MSHVYTLFHPATITPDLERQFGEMTAVGNLQLIYPLDGRWVLVAGVAWPGAAVAEGPLDGESIEDYKSRMGPQIEALFAAGLPDGLVVNLDQLNMIMRSEQWKVLEAVIEYP